MGQLAGNLSIVSQRRILLVDDHPVIRLGYSAVLDREPDLQVCGQAGNIKVARSLLKRETWHLAVVDLQLGDDYGVELIKDMRIFHPDVRVLAVSSCMDADTIQRTFQAGAKGFWHKSECVESMVIAVRKILAGQMYVSTKPRTQLLLSSLKSQATPEPPKPDRLSDREAEILELIGRGRTTGQIARQLHLGHHTVETYRTRIKHKLALQNAPQLAAYAARWVDSHGGEPSLS